MSRAASSGVLGPPCDRVLAKRSRPSSASPAARAALTVRVLLAVALVVALHLHVLQERLHLLLILEVNQARHGSYSQKPSAGPAPRSREPVQGRDLGGELDAALRGTGNDRRFPAAFAVVLLLLPGPALLFLVFVDGSCKDSTSLSLSNVILPLNGFLPAVQF